MLNEIIWFLVGVVPEVFRFHDCSDPLFVRVLFCIPMDLFQLLFSGLNIKKGVLGHLLHVFILQFHRRETNLYYHVGVEL